MLATERECSHETIIDVEVGGNVQARLRKTVTEKGVRGAKPFLGRSTENKNKTGVMRG